MHLKHNFLTCNFLMCLLHFSFDPLKNRFMNRIILMCILHFCFNNSDILMCLLQFHLSTSGGYPKVDF